MLDLHVEDATSRSTSHYVDWHSQWLIWWISQCRNEYCFPNHFLDARVPNLCTQALIADPCNGSSLSIDFFIHATSFRRQMWTRFRSESTHLVFQNLTTSFSVSYILSMERRRQLGYISQVSRTIPRLFRWFPIFEKSREVLHVSGVLINLETISENSRPRIAIYSLQKLGVVDTKPTWILSMNQHESSAPSSK